MRPTRLCSSASVSEVGEPGDDVCDASSVDFGGLKKETSRQILRAFKKVGKTEERLRKALAKESGPADDLESMEKEVGDAKARLKSLNLLEEQLSAMKVMDMPHARHDPVVHAVRHVASSQPAKQHHTRQADNGKPDLEFQS
jgi:hypothetical protein